MPVADYQGPGEAAGNDRIGMAVRGLRVGGEELTKRAGESRQFRAEIEYIEEHGELPPGREGDMYLQDVKRSVEEGEAKYGTRLVERILHEMDCGKVLSCANCGGKLFLSLGVLRGVFEKDGKRSVLGLLAPEMEDLVVCVRCGLMQNTRALAAPVERDKE